MEEKKEEASVFVNTGDSHNDKEDTDDAFVNKVMGLS